MPKEETATRTRAARSTAAAPKRKKDPNAPKRPLTAYLYYANEQRDSVRKANPEMTFGKVHSLIGDNWKKLSAEKKKPYEDLAAKDKQRYEDEKAAYNKKE